MEPRLQSDTPNTVPLWIKAVVGLNALVFLDFGLAFMAKPQALSRYLDIQLTSATALADMRAMYGGLTLAVGVMLVLALRRDEWLRPGLFLVMVTSGGLALGRIYSTLVSGMPAGFIELFLASELLSLAWATLAYRALAVRTIQLPRAPLVTAPR